MSAKKKSVPSADDKKTHHEKKQLVKESKITLPGSDPKPRKETVSVPKVNPERFGRPIGKREPIL